MQEKFKFNGCFNGNKTFALVAMILAAVLGVYSIVTVIENITYIVHGNWVAIFNFIGSACFLLSALFLLLGAKNFNDYNYARLAIVPIFFALLMVFNVISIIILMTMLGFVGYMIKLIVLALATAVFAVLTSVQISKNRSSTLMPLIFWAIANLLALINYFSFLSVLIYLINFAALACALLCFTDLAALGVNAPTVATVGGQPAAGTAQPKAAAGNLLQVIDELKKIKELYDSQLLSEAEYEEKRQKLVERL